MKISEITRQQLKDYMKIDYDDDDWLIDLLMTGVKSYIMFETGLSAEEIDEKPDLTLAYQVLVNEMHANRQMTVDKNKVNVIVERILGMHAVNLL